MSDTALATVTPISAARSLRIRRAAAQPDRARLIRNRDDLLDAQRRLGAAQRRVAARLVTIDAEIAGCTGSDAI